MKCAVVGGGINGVMSTWSLARRGHDVDLYERGELMGAASSASTKLIHGGLRYLAFGELQSCLQILAVAAVAVNSEYFCAEPDVLYAPQS